MITFEKIRFKNFLSYGNHFTEIDFQKAKTTLILGKNGHGKCVDINTKIRLRNKKTGEIIEITIGDFYDSQKKQNS